MPVSLPNPLYLLTGTAAIVVTIVVALWYWRRNRVPRQKRPSGDAAATTGPVPTAQLDVLLRQAKAKLKVAPKMKGVSLTSLPVYLLLGPEKSGKTSLILNSGMDPEPLAGQGSEILAAKSLEIWLAQGCIWIEVASAIASDPAAMAFLIKRLAPPKLPTAFGRTPPPRAIVLCLNVLSADQASDESGDAAIRWNQPLIAASAALGAQLPVYVLFSGCDNIAGFPEFVFNLMGGESAQALGATIRPFNPDSSGVYAVETARVVNESFRQVADSLCDCRIPLMNREQDKVRIANQYQFPREFKKLQKNLVRFLVAVAKPSQLSVSPFLRGFYFIGTRKVVVEGGAPAPGIVSVEPGSGEAHGATRMMSAEQLRQQMAPQPAGSRSSQRETTEWMFTAPLFEQVVLQDHAAQAVSAGSLRTDKLRASLCALLLAAGLFWFAGLSVSYLRNRGLERDLVAGAEAAMRPGSDVYPTLERLREPVQRLLDDQAHTPLSMRWGLYRGETLLPVAQQIYCTAMRDQVLMPVLQRMTDALGQVNQPGNDHSAAFRLLKAYMMMTTHPGKADDSFLADEIHAYWRTAEPLSPLTERLAAGEFRTYGRLLPVEAAQSACVFKPPDGLIPSVQDSLRKLNSNDLYQSFLQQAGRGIEAVDYNKRFPNDAVSDDRRVPGWFTRQGWARMQEQLAHPAQYLNADAWVLGESRDPSAEDLARLAGDFRTRYTAEYSQAWKEYLARASVARYANLEDAAGKLEKMSGPRSFLLSLIGLATENTAALDPFKTQFAPTKMVAAGADDFQPATEYLKQLAVLKNWLKQAAGSSGPAHDQDAQEVRNAARSVNNSVDGIAASPGFKGDTDQLVKDILLKPITQIDGLLRGQDADALKGAVQGLCAVTSKLSRQLPFARSDSEAPVDEVQRIFSPDTGEIFQFLRSTLADSLDCGGADCTVKLQPRHPLSRPFVSFFNDLYSWSRLLNSGRNGLVRLQIRALSHNRLKQAEIVIDGQSKVLLADGAPVTVVWDSHASQELILRGTFEGPDGPKEIARATGPWAIFAWLQDAEEHKPLTTWLPRQGVTRAQRLSNNNTMEYRMEITWGNSRILDLHSMRLSAGCPVPAARN